MAKVKKRNPDLRRIRPSKTYTLPEIAKALDRNIATVRSWVRKGLPLLSDLVPVLVLGSDLKAWLRKTKKAKSRKCQPDELFCFKCRAPRHAKADSVRIIPRNGKTVSIKGQCLVCNTNMNQVGSLAKIVEIENRFSAQLLHKQRLSGCSNASVNQPILVKPKKERGEGKSLEDFHPHTLAPPACAILAGENRGVGQPSLELSKPKPFQQSKDVTNDKKKP